MKKVIVFDLDGTLLDTITEIEFIANLAVTHFGFKKVSLENVKKYIGDGAIHLIARMLKESGAVNESVLNEVFSYYREKYREFEGLKIGYFDGLVEILEKLQNEYGLTFCILSNKPTQNVKRAVEIKLPTLKFEYIIGGGDFPLKPDPTSLNYICEKLGASKQETLFVGDGDADVIVAKNADVHSLSVLWGYREKEELEKVGAKDFVSSPEQFFQYIKERI